MKVGKRNVKQNARKQNKSSGFKEMLSIEG